MAELKAMHDRGIRIVIGPMTSEEALYVLDFADEHDMLLISRRIPGAVNRLAATTKTPLFTALLYFEL